MRVPESTSTLHARVAHHLYAVFNSNVRVQTEARFGADSLEPLVRLHFFVAVTLSHALLKAIEFRFV